MTAAAARTGEMLNYANIASEVGVSEPTIKSWISVLERTGIVYILQPYSASVLNRAIKTPKIYFRDTGLACYLTRWLTAEALKNSAVAGNMFETFIVSEILKTYSNEGKDYRFSIFYYRGKDKKASGEFADSWKDLIYIILFTSQFFVKCVLLYFLYKRIKAKRVIAPTISIEHIVPARWCNMKTYELQHGITTDLTTTYSGVFSPIAHADYFLAFGESSVSPVFGYPIEKVCNVGYAFKQFLKKKSSSKYPENTFLVLSDPEISERIVDTLLLFTKKYPDYIFHIRLHPLEELSDNLKERLANAHVEIADNTINSMLAIMSYHAVIGVNTTVLYEAISVGVKAACISFNGLDPDNYPNPLLKEYFYVISELDDLERFQNNYELSKEQKNYFFSDFNISKFSQLVGF